MSTWRDGIALLRSQMSNLMDYEHRMPEGGAQQAIAMCKTIDDLARGLPEPEPAGGAYAIERAAEAMWRAEVQDIRTARKAREHESWEHQSDSLRGKWIKLAYAALAAAPPAPAASERADDFQIMLAQLAHRFAQHADPAVQKAAARAADLLRRKGSLSPLRARAAEIERQPETEGW